MLPCCFKKESASRVEQASILYTSRVVYKRERLLACLAVVGQQGDLLLIHKVLLLESPMSKTQGIPAMESACFDFIR